MNQQYIRAAVTILSILAATYLAANGKDGWGWLIFLAIIAL